MIVQDPDFGEIVDFDWLRSELHVVYDRLYPDFNLLAGIYALSRTDDDHPGISIAGGASFLAYSMLIAAGEEELAASLKDCVFTLGWTEEHCGSDLLSVRTVATPMEDDPEGKTYHIRGRKWLINNSIHGDYHCVLAKLDPERNGPRSLSLFLVPHSSTRDWERLETRVLDDMVLSTYEVDGPGQILGKPGQGLEIVQRMAIPSKYQCTFMGVRMMTKSIPATIEHLCSKQIFGEHPASFSNVFRQLHDIALRAAYYEFLFHRCTALNESSFLAFYGTMLKSWALLRINELLGHNLLVAGSKGFLRESWIGRTAMDSFVLPVFDGHYTINTLMSSKHAKRYLGADEPVDLEARMETLRKEVFREVPHGEIYADPRSLRRPAFFDYADYVERLGLPIDVPARQLIDSAKALQAEIKEAGLDKDPEHRYKIGDLLHWLESVLVAAEMWRLTQEDAYLNVVIMQVNDTVNAFNAIVAEGGFETPFLSPMRRLPIAKDVEDPQAFLLDLMDVVSRIDQTDVTAPLVQGAPYHSWNLPKSPPDPPIVTAPTVTEATEATEAAALS